MLTSVNRRISTGSTQKCISTIQNTVLKCHKKPINFAVLVQNNTGNEISVLLKNSTKYAGDTLVY